MPTATIALEKTTGGIAIHVMPWRAVPLAGLDGDVLIGPLRPAPGADLDRVEDLAAYVTDSIASASMRGQVYAVEPAEIARAVREFLKR